MYDGGTTLEEAANAIHAKATISMQQYCTEKTLPVIAAHGQETVAFNHPIGVKGTDEFLMEISRISGKPIPAELDQGARPSCRRHGRLEPRISTARNSRSMAIPISASALTGFLMELGAEPIHVLATNGGKAWARKDRDSCSPARRSARTAMLYAGKDLWHMRSLLFTEPVDFLIGNTYGKYLERDTGTPLIRIGFPIFDRHHHHRYPVWGYQGGMNVLVWILDKIFDEIDSNTNVAGEDGLQLRHHSLTARRRSPGASPEIPKQPRY